MLTRLIARVQNVMATRHQIHPTMRSLQSLKMVDGANISDMTAHDRPQQQNKKRRVEARLRDGFQNQQIPMETLMSMSIWCSPASPSFTGTVLRSLYRERMSRLYRVEKWPDPGTAGNTQRRCHAPDFCGLTTWPVSITSAAKPETPPAQHRKDAVPIASSPGGKVPAGALGFSTAKKPWLFRLPTYLRPRQGTTYWASLDVTIEEPAVVGKPNVLQYILCGNPNPDA